MDTMTKIIEYLRPLIYRLAFKSHFTNLKDLLSFLFNKLKALAFLLYHSEIATEITQFVHSFLTHRNTKTAFKAAIIYVSLCLLFELTKQFFIWRHQKYLIKTAIKSRKLHEKRRIELRESLELAVVKGNEPEIESIRKQLAPYIFRDEELAADRKIQEIKHRIQLKVNEIPYSVRKNAGQKTTLYNNNESDGFVIYDHDNDEYEIIDARLAEQIVKEKEMKTNLAEADQYNEILPQKYLNEARNVLTERKQQQKANIYSFLQNFTMIKRLAITDWIMHKNKGQYWNGNNQSVHDQADT